MTTNNTKRLLRTPDGLSIWVYIILWLIVPKAPKRLTE